MLPKERGRWVEYAQQHIQAAAARSRSEAAGKTEHGSGSGAAADRIRRLRMLRMAPRIPPRDFERFGAQISGEFSSIFGAFSYHFRGIFG